MIDRTTSAQVEEVIRGAHIGLAQICASLSDRDMALSVAPASMFLPFVAVSTYLKVPHSVQHAQIRSGLQLVGEVLGSRASAAQYGKGRKCNDDVQLEWAQKAMDLAKRDVDETNLVLHRKEARDLLQAKACLEFCVMEKLLDPEPISLQRMSANASRLCAQVLASGWLTRNEIRIKG